MMGNGSRISHCIIISYLPLVATPFPTQTSDLIFKVKQMGPFLWGTNSNSMVINFMGVGLGWSSGLRVGLVGLPQTALQGRHASAQQGRRPLKYRPLYILVLFLYPNPSWTGKGTQQGPPRARITLLRNIYLVNAFGKTT